MPPPEDTDPVTSSSQTQEIDEEEEQEAEEEASEEQTVGVDPGRKGVRVARNEARPQSSEEEEELGSSGSDEGSEGERGATAVASLLEEDGDFEELDGVDEETEIESMLDSLGDDFEGLDLDDDDLLDEDYISGSLEDE